MELFKVSHLPVVDDKLFLGLVSDTDLYNCDNIKHTLFKEKIILKKIFVYEYYHIYESVEKIVVENVTLLPVVDTKNNFLGSIDLPSVITALSELTSVGKIGSIVVLEMPVIDYTLSQIAQIAENNNIIILSSYIRYCSDFNKIQLTLKLNKTEIEDMKRSLERYNYNIVYVFKESQVMDEMYQERLDELLRYMNI
jgi:CBS domain-containing protein